ncbi:MAG TPA: hypothetical protein VMC42_03210 [Methanoregulaceae archaeon]|nr:hypothetical protein [Methanoregulaceae archaeon]
MTDETSHKGLRVIPCRFLNGPDLHNQKGGNPSGEENLMKRYSLTIGGWIP